MDKAFTESILSNVLFPFLDTESLIEASRVSHHWRKSVNLTIDATLDNPSIGLENFISNFPSTKFKSIELNHKISELRRRIVVKKVTLNNFDSSFLSKCDGMISLSINSNYRYHLQIKNFNLKELHVPNSDLDDKMISGMRLEKLTIDNCYKIDGSSFQSLTELQYLSARNCQLADHLFNPLVRLQVLIVNENKLFTGIVLCSLSELKKLWVTDCPNLKFNVEMISKYEDTFLNWKNGVKVHSVIHCDEVEEIEVNGEMKIETEFIKKVRKFSQILYSKLLPTVKLKKLINLRELKLCEAIVPPIDFFTQLEVLSFSNCYFQQSCTIKSNLKLLEIHQSNFSLNGECSVLSVKLTKMRDLDSSILTQFRNAVTIVVDDCGRMRRRDLDKLKVNELSITNCREIELPTVQFKKTKLIDQNGNLILRSRNFNIRSDDKKWLEDCNQKGSLSIKNRNDLTDDFVKKLIENGSSLSIRNCFGLTFRFLTYFINLQSLFLDSCPNITELPIFSVNELKLHNMRLKDCKKLKVKLLEMRNCPFTTNTFFNNVEGLEEIKLDRIRCISIFHPSTIKRITITNCPSFHIFMLFKLNQIEKLTINESEITANDLSFFFNRQRSKLIGELSSLDRIDFIKKVLH